MAILISDNRLQRDAGSREAPALLLGWTISLIFYLEDSMTYIERLKEQVLSRSERIDSEISNIRDCPHEKKEIRYRLCSNGNKMYIHQCLRCGQNVGAWIHKNSIANISSTKPIDDELKKGVSNLLLELYKRKSIAKKADFFDDYDEYLRSSEWTEKRHRVLNRCHNICEGCGKNKAVQVHHLSYQHYRNEFLFELVGICKKCHDTLHEKQDGQDAAINA
jgi:hypothetical protein